MNDDVQDEQGCAVGARMCSTSKDVQYRQGCVV